MIKRDASAASAVFIVFILASASTSPKAASASGQQLCTDVGSGPVLQDSNWGLLYPPSGYHDFATKYLDAGVGSLAGPYLVLRRVPRTRVVSS